MIGERDLVAVRNLENNMFLGLNNHVLDFEVL